jgi:hypothetical protein
VTVYRDAGSETGCIAAGHGTIGRCALMLFDRSAFGMFDRGLTARSLPPPVYLANDNVLYQSQVMC